MIRALRFKTLACASALSLACGVGCSSTSSTSSTEPAPSTAACDSLTPRWVTISRYDNAECTGTPKIEQTLPAHYGSTCCSATTTQEGHENSSGLFTCGADSFSYTQWTSLTCSGGQQPAGTVKSYTLTGCTEDTPPGMWGRITDFSGCK